MLLSSLLLGLLLQYFVLPSTHVKSAILDRNNKPYECQLLVSTNKLDELKYWFINYGLKMSIKDKLTLHKLLFAEEDAISVDEDTISSFGTDEEITYPSPRFDTLFQIVHFCEIEYDWVPTNKTSSSASSTLLVVIEDKRYPLSTFTSTESASEFDLNVVTNYLYAARHAHDFLVLRTRTNDSQLIAPHARDARRQFSQFSGLLTLLELLGDPALQAYTKQRKLKYEYILCLSATTMLNPSWHSRPLFEIIRYWNSFSYHDVKTPGNGVHMSKGSVVFIDDPSSKVPGAAVLVNLGGQVDVHMEQAKAALWYLIESEGIKLGQGRTAELKSLQETLKGESTLLQSVSFFESYGIDQPCVKYSWLCVHGIKHRNNIGARSLLLHDMRLSREMFEENIARVASRHYIDFSSLPMPGQWLHATKASSTTTTPSLVESLSLSHFDATLKKLANLTPTGKSSQQVSETERNYSDMYNADIFTIQPFFSAFENEYIFQDIFIGSGDLVFFVSAPTAWFHSKENLEKHLNAFLHLPAPQLSIKPINVSVNSSHETKSPEFHFLGTLQHQDISDVLRISGSVNISINFSIGSRVESKTFSLKRERPRWPTTKRQLETIIFTLFKTDEEHQIENFVNYYRLLGIDSFMLYLNGKFSQFPNVNALAKRYGRDGVPVVFAEWPYSPYMKHSGVLGNEIHYAQQSAITSALYRAKEFAKWIGFFDLDEYVFIPAHTAFNIPSLLESFPETKIGVIFRNSWAVLEHAPWSSKTASAIFSIADLKQRMITYDTTMDSIRRTKYFVRTKCTQTAFIHKFLHAGNHDVRVANDGSLFFLHFSLEHIGEYEVMYRIDS